MSQGDPMLVLGSPDSHGNFTSVDYVVFASMLIVSASVGIYYAFRGVHETTEDFFLGSRSLHCVPVALSLTASFMSAVTVLGTPAEVYRYGMKFGLFAISYVLVVALTAHVFMPVYYRLGITSAYEVSYSGIVIYAPSLALNQVTGFQLWGAIIGTGVICTFYCTLGGLKAVVWTDVFQFLLMLFAFIFVIGRTVSKREGLSHILDDARHGGRLDVWDFNPSPLQRHTFWTIVIGGSFTWLGVYAVNQFQVQRYLSCKTLGHAKLALYINLLGLWLTLTCAVLSGLSMYSMFKDCDPWTAKKVAAPDQLMPYLVLKLWKDYPGIPGLFVAGTYSGTLSTVSSSINALATVTVQDLVRPNFKTLSQGDLASISMGMIVYPIPLLVLRLASLTIFGIIGGPLLGIFALGVLLPSANSKGAFSGLICGLTIVIWLGIGSLMYPPLPHRTMPLQLSTAGCHVSNWTVPTTITKPPTAPRFAQPINYILKCGPHIADNWYSLSYLYLSTAGTIVTFTVGIVMSLSTGGLKQDIDHSLVFGKEDLIADYEYLRAKAVSTLLQILL
ncbi:hypothetical protein lerEdw1_003904 [Lerista edwardsae]|nr:hypothetical protein lerEdw1_003904 [Lerista edwardsae]